MNSFPQSYSVPRLAISRQRWRIFQCSVLVFLLAWLYLPILSHLAHQWLDDPNYSHGFLVPIFSLFVLWRERSRLAHVIIRPSTWGLLILVLAVGVLMVGVLGAELFLSRVSLLFVLAGLIVFFFGWQCFRIVLFPWAFLILMVPVPSILIDRVTFPLQILASTIAGTLLPLFGVPVLREGNIIHLPAMPLEVAEACSGIRSLLSLMTLTLIYGFLTETDTRTRILLALASVPIAVAANSLRIVVTGILVQYWDPIKAQGFFHHFSGWLIFLISFVLLTLLHRLFGAAESKRRVV